MSTLQVSNPGTSAREVHLQITGPAANWSWVVPATLLVPAGATANARIVFSPPGGAKLPAGAQAFSVSVSGGAEPVVVEGTVGIRTFHDLFLALGPAPEVAGGGGGSRHLLTVENRGNAVVRADVDASASSGVGEPAERRLTATVGADPHRLVGARSRGRPRRRS